MRKPLAILLASLLSVAAPAFAQAPVKIGFIGELSGSVGVVGQDQFDAFMMVVERNGGKLGGVPVQVLRNDSQLKPEVATQIVQRLIEKENVPIITGISFSNVMLAVHKAITEKQVFLIGSNAGPSQIAGAQCSPYQFMTSWQGDQAAEAVGKYAADKGYRRVFVMAPNYQAGKDVVTGFKRYYKTALVDEVYTPLNQQDFAAELAQVQAKKPDAVFAFYPGGLGISFVRQYQQAGLIRTVPLLSTFTVDATTLPALKDSANGLISGAFWGPDFANEENRRFVEEFERKYNRIPSNYAAQSYDAANLIDAALAKVKGNVADKPALMAAFKAAEFRSVRGAFRFNNNNFPIQDMHIFEVANDARGRPNLKTVATPLKATVDAYHTQCALK